MKLISYSSGRQINIKSQKVLVIGILTLALGTATVVLSVDSLAQATPVAATQQRTDLRSNLYAENLISESMAAESSANLNRPIGRAEFAELVVRLHLKANASTVSALSPQSFIKDSKSPFVNAAYDLRLMGADNKKRFNPNGAITREQAAVVVNQLLRNVPAGYSNFYKNAAVKTPTLQDSKSVAPTYLQPVRAVVSSGLFSLNNGAFRPKANLTLNEALQIIDKSVTLTQVRGASDTKAGSANYKTVKIDKYLAPDGQETDLLTYVPSNGSADLIMNFTGVFMNPKTPSAKTIHLQVVTTVLSGKGFSTADGIALLKAIESGWDETARKYQYGKDLYIRGGLVQENQPAKPYIQIRSGSALSVDVHETH